MFTFNHLYLSLLKLAKLQNTSWKLSHFMITRYLVLYKEDRQCDNHSPATNATHLNVAKRLFRHKVNGDGKEIVCVTSDSEFHRARLVRSINDRQTPFQDVFTTIVPVIALTLSHYWSTGTRSNNKNKQQ